MRTRTANLRVNWAGGMLPPDVYVGRTVCGAGKVKTRDGGNVVTIFDAVPLTAGRSAMQAFMQLLDEQAADPTDWCPELLAKFPHAG